MISFYTLLSIDYNNKVTDSLAKIKIMEDFQALDLLFLAAIAGYLIYRLYSVLGQRRGVESPQNNQGKQNNVIPLRSSQPQPASQARIYEPDEKTNKALLKLASVDSSFNLQAFLEGAQGAFKMIIEAFNNGDSKTLKPLVNPTIYGRFSAVMGDLKKTDKVNESNLLRLQSLKITDVAVRGTKAKITLKFISDQIQAIRDAKGKVVQGDPDQIEVITDLWTFSKDTTSTDPNWQLVATQTPD